MGQTCGLLNYLAALEPQGWVEERSHRGPGVVGHGDVNLG